MKFKTVMTLPATCVAAAAGLIIVFSSGAPISSAAQAPPQIPQELRNRVQRDGRVRVIVELALPTPHRPEGTLLDADSVTAQRQRIAGRAAQFLAKLPVGSHRTMRRYETVPYVALEVTPAALDALERLTDDVVTIRPDVVHRPSLAESVPLIEADQVWSSGFDGTGMMIAVLDTGVDSAHPFLTGKVVEEACYSTGQAGLSQSFCPNGLGQQIGAGAAAPCPLPTCEHGTHVAGIAAGGDSDPSHPFPGVAKGAQLMAVQVFSAITDAASCGGTPPCVGAFTSDIIAALERVYAVALSGQHHVASVNMSLGAGNFTAPCDDQPYKPAIDNLRAIGVASVIAAGNDSSSSGLGAPACISSAVSVGATDKQDVVAFFSNTAPFLSLFAPGVSITSSVPGGGYQALSGTSMAAPHVAGVWGLLKEAAPEASVSTILSALRTTGLPVTDNRFLFSDPVTVPRVRAFQALSTLVAIDNPVPVITSLSPAVVRGGLGALTLTVTGSGFNIFSVVEWNGTPRPTQLISGTKVQASLSAADVAAEGTGNVTVFNPAPGGGMSLPLTVTISPPVSLTISAPTVGRGAQETVTLAAGFGGSSDWLALAATGASNISYLQFTYVGAGVINRTWTVTMPSTAGTYEFRLFANNARVATSPPVTVDPTYNAPPTVSSLSPATAAAGTPSFTMTVNGGNFVASSLVRWNGADRPTTFVSANQLRAAIPASDITAVGTAQVTVFSPAPGGGTSAALTFTTVPQPVLTVSATTVTSGGAVTMTLTNGLGGSGDWLVFASASAPNTSYLQFVGVGAGVRSRTWTVNVPRAPGPYEFRLFADGGYTRIATSPTITVPSAVLSVDPATSQGVAAGSPVTVTLTNGLGGATDWIALAATTAPDASYLQFIYVGADVTTRTWTVAMPSTPGTYEFRLFLNNSSTRVATSPPVSVMAGMPVLTFLSPAVGAVGGTAFTLTANGSGFSLSSVVRWNGVSRTTTFVNTTQLRATIPASDLAAVGTAQVTVFSPPPGGGVSAPSLFTIASALPQLELAVSQTTAVGGTPVTVTLLGGSGGSGDWLAFAATTAANTSYLQYTYVGVGVTTRTWTVTMPAGGGTYEFRLFPNNGYTRAATSPPITVTPAPPPSLTVDRTSAAPGSPVTVTLTDGRGGSYDWLAFAPTTAPNTSSPQWTWVGAGVTTRTWTINAPTTSGTYEFRLFLNNGYVREATSAPITVP